jgi:hypothetical protein
MNSSCGARWLFSLCLVLVLLTIDAVADSSQRSTLSLQSINISSSERIVSFEIRISAGAFRTISNLPLGWTVDIDNDASWHTTARGSLMVGAAALSPEEFKKLQFLIEKNEFEDLKFHVEGTISVTKDFQKTRKIQLNSSDFSLTPAK